jgi:hypothetical protein
MNTWIRSKSFADTLEVPITNSAGQASPQTTAPFHTGETSCQFTLWSQFIDISFIIRMMGVPQTVIHPAQSCLGVALAAMVDLAIPA